MHNKEYYEYINKNGVNDASLKNVNDTYDHLNNRFNSINAN